MLLRFSLMLAALYAISLSAGPGDTFTVNTHNKVVIKTNPAVGSTRYFGWGEFPAAGTSYQKAWAELTFRCAPGLKCGEWDYLNYIYLVKRRGKVNDSLGWEIMRMITPYGFYWDNTWKHTWVFDITDFAHLLHDSVQIMYMHTGYEASHDRGWEISLDFKLVKGTPWREVKNITRFYTQSTGYGNDSLFEARVPEKTFTLGPETDLMRFKILQTGHGMDRPENCAEFCPKRRRIVLDGKMVDESWVWRDDCGENPVFPQAGTWLYDRAGWCPGAEVREYNLDLPATPGNTHTWDLDMESYTTSNGGANYMLSTYLVEYGKPAFRTDVGIEDIMAPSDQIRYKRINPYCGSPQVIISNKGASAVSSIDFLYGMAGKKQLRYRWTGQLASGATDTVFLPAGFETVSGPGRFEVRVIWVNNAPDGYAGNNYAVSNTGALPPVLPARFIVICATNRANTENSYVIRDRSGNIVYRRDRYPAAQTIYRDTITLNEGCYTFDFQDTGRANPAFPLNEDGLEWWANTTDGNGTLQLRTVNNTLIQRFGTDFGTFVKYAFTVGNIPAPGAEQAAIRVYPNPGNGILMVDLTSLSPESLNKPYTIVLNDMRGRKVMEKEVPAGFLALHTLDISKIANGVYHLKIVMGDFTFSERVIKE